MCFLASKYHHFSSRKSKRQSVRNAEIYVLVPFVLFSFLMFYRARAEIRQFDGTLDFVSIDYEVTVEDSASAIVAQNSKRI